MVTSLEFIVQYLQASDLHANLERSRKLKLCQRPRAMTINVCVTEDYAICDAFSSVAKNRKKKIIQLHKRDITLAEYCCILVGKEKLCV